MAKKNIKKIGRKVREKAENIKSKSKNKLAGNIKALIVILFYTFGIVVATTILIFGLYIEF